MLAELLSFCSCHCTPWEQDALPLHIIFVQRITGHPACIVKLSSCLLLQHTMQYS